MKRDYTAPELIAGYSALIAGTITHMFGLVNVLHNYDDIVRQPSGYGTGIESGRWMLTVLGGFFKRIDASQNTTFFNGIVFLLFLAFSAAILVSVLQIKNKKMAALLGALFVTFPAVCSTMIFRYTVGYYGIAVLLSVLAVWFVEKYAFGLPLSILCICCSLGIYQAYIPITITVFILALLRRSLYKSAAFRHLVLRGVYYCMAIILGLVLYFVLMNHYLEKFNVVLGSYQGVDQMGQLSLAQIPVLIKEAYVSFLTFPARDYCDLAGMPVIRNVYYLLFLISVGLLGYICFRYVKKPLLIAFAVVMCLLLPLAMNFIVVMTPDGWVYTIMVYAFVFVGMVPVILMDRVLEEAYIRPERKTFFERAIVLVLGVLIACYGYQTNVNYNAVYFANRQVENYLNSMIVQVRMTEGFTPEQKWAFIGKINDPLWNQNWEYEDAFGGVAFKQQLMHQYSWMYWPEVYFGYTLPLADGATIENLQGNDEVKAMPCWPAQGSIKVIDNMVVIKLQEVQ